jgi:lipoyl(octanoyl) transferase
MKPYFNNRVMKQQAPHKQVYIQHWGMIDYSTAFERQENLQKEIIKIKVANHGQAHPLFTPNYLIFCEHPHVYTLGKRGSQDHLLVSEAYLQEQQAVFFRTNRGGDITYHGPGQLVVYPILDLENFFTDIDRYLRLLEEAVIITLQGFNLSGGRIPGWTGVWMDVQHPQSARKICAMGIRISRWVTMHGLALNIATNLRYFEHIIPCGIATSQITSMEQELGYIPPIQQVSEALQGHLVRLLDMKVA